MNIISKLLVICSGSSLSILKKTPTEIAKHAGIGGVVLFTGIFASLAAGYALYTIFDNIWYAVGFGFLWGLMIFNLDRYIVSSMRKSGKKRQQFFMALPRLVMAFFLGVVIAHPLELKIFEKEIDKQLNVIINRNKKMLEDSTTIRFNNQTLPYTQEKDSILARRKQLQSSYDSAVVDYEREVLGKNSGTTSGREGYGPHAKRKEQLMKDRKQQFEEYTTRSQTSLDSLNSQLSTIYKELDSEIKDNNTVENKYNGMLARMQALGELEEQHPIMKLASRFIMGIFIMLEISPVLVKLISPKGPYDELLGLTEFKVKQYAQESTEKELLESDKRIQLKKNSIEKELSS